MVKMPELIPHTVLFSVRAGDLPLHRWFGLHLEEPLEDTNFQDGYAIESTPQAVVVQYGCYLERQTYKPDDELIITWFSWSVK